MSSSSVLPCRPRRLCAKEAVLRSYDGPTLFAIPGNHGAGVGCQGARRPGRLAAIPPVRAT